MEHLFVINPAAGRVDRTEALTQEINSLMRGRGEAYEIYVTRAPMDACGAIREWAAAGGELRVYACGGDGTLNECVNGAAGLDNVAVTHYPTGTGNDFCKIFGADAARFRDLSQLLDAQVAKLDLIDCCGRYGINICSVGVDARIGTDVHKYSGVLPGGGAYILSTAVNFIKGVNRRMTLTLGGESVTEDFALICVCSGRYYGGGFNPMPEAEPDDGLLDALVVRKASRLKFIRLIGKFRAGLYRELPPEIIYSRRVSSVCVEAEEELRVNVDGELLRTKRADFTVRPGYVNFFFPKGASWKR